MTSNFPAWKSVIDSGMIGAGLTFSGGLLSATVQSGVGVGQTWQNVAGSRALSTTYTNSTGKPIMVNVEVSGGSAGAAGTLVVSGVTVSTYNEASLGGATMCAIVPDGATYSATMTGATPSIVTWSELR